MPKLEAPSGGTLWVLLIGTVIFLVSFVTFVNMIPSEAYVPYKDYEQYYEDQAQDRFIATQVNMFNATDNFNLTQGEKTKTYLGLQIRFYFSPNFPVGGRFIWIYHVDFEILGYPLLSHDLRTDPFDLTTLRKDTLFNEQFYDADADASIVTWQCEHIALVIRISSMENTTSLNQAWEDGELRLDVNYEIDFAKMGTSVWGLLGSILTFQTITTGINTLDLLLNALVTIPVWTSIIYITYRIITGLIPFLSGGGGA